MAMMPRMISEVPEAMLAAGALRNACCYPLLGVASARHRASGVSKSRPLRTEDRHADARHGLCQLGPVELDDRGLGPRHPHAQELVERALASVAEGFDAEVHIGERLALHRIAGGALLAGRVASSDPGLW